ncbi:MAG: hypothetical protein VW935_19135 [Novosphingobium sp.]
MPDLPPPVIVQQAEEVRRFDLAIVKSDTSCGSGASGQIVVCAVDSKRYRLRPPSSAFREAGPPKAEVALPGGGAVAVEAQAQSVGGFNSNRVLVGVKLPF